MKYLKRLIGMGIVWASIGTALAAYPERPVKIVVPYPAGGGTDVITRLIAKSLGDKWGQPVIVDNRPGADTQIGNMAVASAAPDGYTLLVIAPTFTMHKNLVASLPYDPMKDFTPIAPMAYYSYFLAVGNDVPAKSAKDLVALAKLNPGKLNHAVSSSGQLVLAEMMKRSAGIDVLGVRYKGGTPALQALVSGEVTYHIDQSGTIKPMLDAGKVRVLAVTGDKRSPFAPNVPTFAEAGLAGGDIISWLGLAGPKGMPASLVEAINAAVSAAVASPEVKKGLDQLTATPMVSNPGEFNGLVRREAARYEKLIKQYDIKE